VDDDVAVGVGVRLLQQLDGLAVEIHFVPADEERVGRHRRGWLAAFSPAHAQLRVLMRDDLGGVGRVRPCLRREVAGDNRPAGFRDRDIPANVIGWACVLTM
jgi:hypothetical protein